MPAPAGAIGRVPCHRHCDFFVTFHWEPILERAFCGDRLSGHSLRQELQQMFMLDESVQAIFGTTHYLASVAQLVAGDDDYKPDRRLMQVRERRFGDSTANESGTTDYLVHFDGWSDRCDQQLYFC